MKHRWQKFASGSRWSFSDPKDGYIYMRDEQDGDPERIAGRISKVTRELWLYKEYQEPEVQEALAHAVPFMDGGSGGTAASTFVPPPKPTTPPRGKSPAAKKPRAAAEYTPHRWPEVTTELPTGTPVRYADELVGYVDAGKVTISGSGTASGIAKKLIREGKLTEVNTEGVLT